MANEPRILIKIAIDGTEGARELDAQLQRVAKRFGDLLDKETGKAPEEAAKSADQAARQLIEKRRRLSVSVIEDEKKRKLAALNLQYQTERRQIQQLLRLRQQAGKITEQQAKRQLAAFDRDLRAVRDRQAAALDDVAQKSGLAKLGGLGLGRLGLAGGVAAIGAGAVRTLKEAVDNAVAFERELTQVQKTADLTDSELETLGERLLELSGRLGIGRTSLAEIAAVAGQLGIKGADDISTFTETVAKLADVTDLGAEEAAEKLAEISNVFGIPIAQAEKLGSVLNALENTTTAKAGAIADVLQRVGTAGASIGLTVPEVAALGATLKQAGIDSQRGGTQLRNILIFLQTETAKAARTAGLTRDAFSALVQEDALEALLAYLEGLKGVEAEARASTIKDLFGQENFQAVSALAGATDELRERVAFANAEFDRGTSLNEEFARTLDDVSKQMEILRARSSALLTALGSRLLPTINRILGAFIDLSDETGGAVQNIRNLDEEYGRLSGLEASIERLGELEKVQKRSKEEQAEYEQLLRDVSAAYPQYVRETNAAGEAIAVYADELKRAVQERLNLNRAEQLDSLGELASDYLEASREAEALRAKQQEMLGVIERLTEELGADAPVLDLMRDRLPTIAASLKAAQEEVGGLGAELGALFAQGLDTDALVQAFVRQGDAVEVARARVNLLEEQYKSLKPVIEDAVEPETTGGDGDSATKKQLEAAARAAEQLAALRERLAVEGEANEDRRAALAIQRRFDEERKRARELLDIQQEAKKIDADERVATEKQIFREIAAAEEQAFAEQLARIDERTDKERQAREQAANEIADVEAQTVLERETARFRLITRGIENEFEQREQAIRAEAALARQAEQAKLAAQIRRIRTEEKNEDAANARIELLEEQHKNRLAEIDDNLHDDLDENRKRYEREMKASAERIAGHVEQAFVEVLRAIEAAFDRVNELSQAEIDLRRLDFEERRRELEQELASGEGDSRRILLELKVLEEERRRFENEVEKAGAGFFRRFFRGLFNRRNLFRLIEIVGSAIIRNAAGAAEGGFVEDQERYTGSGGKYQPAGLVHKGEFVLTKRQVRGDPRPFFLLAKALEEGLLPQDLADMLRESGYGRHVVHTRAQGFGFASGGFVQAAQLLQVPQAAAPTAVHADMSEVRALRVDMHEIRDDLRRIALAPRPVIVEPRKAARLNREGDDYERTVNPNRKRRAR